MHCKGGREAFARATALLSACRLRLAPRTGAPANFSPASTTPLAEYALDPEQGYQWNPQGEQGPVCLHKLVNLQLCCGECSFSNLVVNVLWRGGG